jgi:hypothetical protein
MKRIVILVSILLTVLAVAQARSAWAQSHNALVLYDDFNGRQIDPAKWEDWMASGGMLEAVRELSPPYQGQGNNRRLNMYQQAYSWPWSDDGANYGWLGLTFTNPASVVEISFDIEVDSAKFSVCQSNPSITSNAWAGFVGRFFNYGGQQNPNQDVGAEISLGLDATNPKGPVRVNADYTSDIASEFQTLGFVSLGKTATVHVKWDQPNNQFIFQLNSNPVVSMVYNLPVVSPPTYPLKALWVARGTPNCTTTPRGSAMMNAYFDNVYVNAP